MATSDLFSSLFNQDDDPDEQISAKVNWVDYVAIGVYFAVIVAVGIWTTRKNKKDTVDNYFLAGRNMHWLPVGASLFASNIGSEHFVGLSGSGASVGIGIAGFEYDAMYVLLILGWFFMPVYLASNVSTMPEYLQKRFGGQRIRIYLSLLALILYIFTKISACLFAGSLFIKLLLNLDNIYVAIVILLVVSALFTIFGGLTTVMWTELVQVLFMLIGATYLAIISLNQVGGYKNLTSTFAQAGLPNGTKYQSYKNGCDPLVSLNCTSCSEITPYYLNLFRPATDDELPWPGIIGMTVSSVWYWCTDQVIVQRGLSAKNLTYAKAGCIVASLMKVFPMFLLVIPGMAARMLWPNQIGCSNPDYCERLCGSPSGCSNLAYPYIVIRLMPTGATGLMVSVIIAALMSSLTSIFNSASTIFIIDIYTRFRKRASEIEQVIVGRFFVVFLVVVSVAWIPIIQHSQNSQLFQYIQSVTSFLSPPVCAVYILSMFWNRTTEQGAFWSLVVGLIIGLVRMILEFAIPAPACSSTEPDPRPTFVSKIHYLHFGIILFVISAIITIVISLLTKKPSEKQLYRLTFSTIHSEEVREELDSNENIPEQKEALQNNGEINKWISLICCVKPDNVTDKDPHNYNLEKELDPEELARIHAQSAKDDPKWAPYVNMGAVLVIVICSFFWGFYA